VKALTKLSPAAGDLAVRSQPVPEPGPGEALVRVTAVGLCGSDVHAIKAHAGYEWVRTPVTLGHEITGVVATVAGGAREVSAGSPVGVISMDGCRACDLCASGRRPLCAERTVIGLSNDGGAAVGVAQDEAVRLPLLRQCGFATRTEPPAEPAGAWIEASGSVAALAAIARGVAIKAALRP
jgi:L-iditol 2-dehydrogenase